MNWFTALFTTLVFLVPLGTRLIWHGGQIAGVPLEWGTLGLFGTQILALALIAVVLARSGRDAMRLVQKEKIARATLFFLGVAAFATLGSHDFVYGLTMVMWLAIGYGLVLAFIIKQPSSKPLLLALVASGAAQAVLALVQSLTQNSFVSKWLGLAAHDAAVAGTFVVETASGRWLRAYGTFSHPNMLAAWLALALVAAVWLYAREERRWLRATMLAISVLCAAAILLTFSKSGLLALAIGLVVLTVVTKAAERRSLLAPIAVSILTISIFVATFRDPILNRLSGQGRLERQSTAERVSTVTDGRQLWLRHPLFGVGPGNTPAAIVAELDTTRSPYAAQPPHFTPLTVAVETGLAGLLCWLTIVILAVQAAWRRRKHDAFAIAALATLLAPALFDHFLWSFWPGQLMFWVIVALTSVLEAGAVEAHVT